MEDPSERDTYLLEIVYPAIRSETDWIDEVAVHDALRIEPRALLSADRADWAQRWEDATVIWRHRFFYFDRAQAKGAAGAITGGFRQRGMACCVQVLRANWQPA